ncbi:GmrSD restriction endonuclease domain-containing protein [Chamaesiphon minutus]|uniref:GmrSD restriction endonucleases N-terminal domain-containing protein n=1 Tax=Chamaesiphon minutus (strain ATCC 27169 / PCC 6605) TaxID=1173020 RepID=K9UKU2_CHAP6|nr:DUF262 domain-containing protein [Chamaesiphon minutus]AFY95722.1 hypothetical protein Cha6605_4808 [Chamaesiphon minutus PCC 6605]
MAELASNINSENIEASQDHEFATWFESEPQPDEGYSINEYEITTSPNDFNIKTMYDFIKSGAINIPGFQRNYVWDIKRASKLIESIVIGLPIPQIFLYQESRNKFLVIDGQQRLMSLYYFIEQRFPKDEKRTTLRRIFEENGKIPVEILGDDNYFTKFNLQLPPTLPGQPNKLHGINYSTLDEYKISFDLRTMRNIIVKQNFPEEDDSCIHEIFNRLNSGGINLKPQEIRTSMYYSDFYNMLYRLNTLPEWRKIIGVEEPDLNMKDIEILLRGFAMLMKKEEYQSSMVRFLNSFSKECKRLKDEQIKYLEELFKSFLATCSELPDRSFQLKTTNKFNISVFEAVFFAQCRRSFESKKLAEGKIDYEKLEKLKNDSGFIDAIRSQTTSKENVTKRLERATRILCEQC